MPDPQSPMTSRQRFLAHHRYQPTDRAPFPSFMAHPWTETLERWKREGYVEGAYDRFGFDRWEWQGGWFFPNPPFEYRVVEETETTRLYVNHEGILMRERKDFASSSMPQFVRFPVETREEFRRFWKERMQPDLASRLGPDWKARLEAYRQRDFPLIIIADRWGGCFGSLRNMLGVEKLSLLFIDAPSFVEEMMEANADFLIAVIGQILDHTDVDVFGFWEDMAYKTAPLISPAMMRKYALPRYRRVVEYVRSRGVEFVALDSDGQITSLIPVWLEAGINVLYPFEVQAGMDVVAVRKEFGRDLRMWGGFDKRALATGPEAIDRELDRLAALVTEGGYVPGLDHSCPPDISWPNFCYYAENLPRILY